MEPHPLTTFRARLHLSQQQLADLLKVSRVTITRWESGTRQPDKNILPRIKEVTGIAPSELRPDIAKLIEAA